MCLRIHKQRPKDVWGGKATNTNNVATLFLHMSVNRLTYRQRYRFIQIDTYTNDCSYYIHASTSNQYNLWWGWFRIHLKWCVTFSNFTLCSEVLTKYSISNVFGSTGQYTWPMFYHICNWKKSRGHRQKSKSHTLIWSTISPYADFVWVQISQIELDEFQT